MTVTSIQHARYCGMPFGYIAAITAAHDDGCLRISNLVNHVQQYTSKRQSVVLEIVLHVAARHCTTTG